MAVFMILLFQVRLEELCYFLEEVIACVAAIVDAVVAVGVDCSLELLAGLCQSICVVYHVTEMIHSFNSTIRSAMFLKQELIFRTGFNLLKRMSALSLI